MDLRKGRQSRSNQYVTQTFKMLLLGTFIFVCISTLNHFKLSNYFPIKTVRVYGVNRMDRQEIQELVVPLVKQGFFTVNVDYIRDRLLQMPWVSEIFVRRNWPDQVEITVVEKNAIARWKEQSLLSASGELFTPKLNTYPPNLPILNGPEGKQIVMLQYFNQMNRLLIPLHAKISSLELTPYSTWKLTLDNGITLQIGHKDVLTRLSHFVKVFPKIVKDSATGVEYVDLRYPNGMAVRWKGTVVAESHTDISTRLKA